MQVALAYTCIQLLSLPAGSLPQRTREAVQAELLRAAAVGGPVHLSAVLQDTSAPAEFALALGMLQLRAPAGRYSKFAGLVGEDGLPTLLPSHPFCPGRNSSSSAVGSQAGLAAGAAELGGPAAPSTINPSAAKRKGSPPGALQVCVGDAVEVLVEVHSALPQPVALGSVRLVLALLQDVAVAYSPKAAAAPTGLTSAGGSMHLRTQRMSRGFGGVLDDSQVTGDALTEAAQVLHWMWVVLPGVRLQHAHVLLVVCTRLAVVSADVAGGLGAAAVRQIFIADSWSAARHDRAQVLGKGVSSCQLSTLADLRVLVLSSDCGTGPTCWRHCLSG